MLRGLAAIAVVLYHLQHYIAVPNMGNNPDTLFRFFGVEFSFGAWFFFTLSGFLMAYMIDIGYRGFLPRRLIRIYPTYIVAVAGVLLAKELVFESLAQPNLLRCMTLLPFGATAGGRPMGYPLSVEWTLVYEVFFYLVCAVFATRLTRRLFLPFLAIWSAAIILNANDLMFHVTLSPTESWLLPHWKYIGLSTLNLLFIAGAAAYHIYKRVNGSSRILCSGLGIAGIASFATSRIVRPGLIEILLLGTSFALVVLGVCLCERNATKALPAAGVLGKLGDYSYALYLVHVPVISCLLVVAQYKLGRPMGTGLAMGVFATAMLAGWYFGKFDVALHGYLRKQWDNSRFGGRRKAPHEAPAKSRSGNKAVTSSHASA